MFNVSWKVFSTGLLGLGIALLAFSVIGCKDASNKTAVNATLSRTNESMPLDGGEGARESREAYDPIEARVSQCAGIRAGKHS